MKAKSKVTILLACLVPLLSCTKQGTAGEETEGRPVSLFLTKSLPDGTTFTAFLFSTLQQKNLGAGSKGEYYSSGTDLVPGTSGSKDISKGLVATNENYSLTVVSPTTDLSVITGTSFYGIPCARSQIAALYKSKLSSFRVEGIYADKQYAINLGELTEIRSLVRVTVKCGANVESAVLHSVILKDLLKSTWYLPQTGEYYHSSSTDVFEDVDCGLTDRTLTTGQTVTSEDDVYVIAQDYSAKDEYSQPKYVMPKLQIKLGQSGSTQVTIPLNDDMTGQKIFHYTISVNSVWVTVSVDILPWTEASLAGDMRDMPDAGNVIHKENWYPVVNDGVIE